MEYIDLVNLGIVQLLLVLFLVYVVYKINYKHVFTHIILGIAGIGVILIDFDVLIDLFLSVEAGGLFFGCVIIYFVFVMIIKFQMYVDARKTKK